MKKLALLAPVGLVALLSSCGGEAPAVVAAPAQTVTATVTATKTVATPGPTVTVTKTVTKDKVPQACLDALDLADNAIGVAGEGFEIASEAFGAISDFDVDLLTELTTQMSEDIGPKLNEALDAYDNARSKCRG